MQLTGSVSRGSRGKAGRDPGHMTARTILKGFAIALPVDFTGVTTRRGLDLTVQGDSAAHVRGCLDERLGAARFPAWQGLS